MAEPFQTQVYQPGIEGLNLKAASDLVSPTQLLVMTNVVGSKESVGELQSRPGQLSAVTGGTEHHSIGLLVSLTGNVVLVIGADTKLYYGVSGPLTLVDSGYSGDPLWFVSYRPVDSALDWLFIGDSVRMRKISSEGLVLPIGLPAVSAAVAGVLGTEQKTNAELFTATAGWGVFAYNGSAVPGQPTADANPDTGNGLKFTTTPGAATGAYANAWDHAIAVDFTQVGSKEASDSDYISFFMKLAAAPGISASNIINDIRLDFGVGGAGDNFYTKHFRPSDFTQVSISGEQDSITGEDQVARFQQLDQALNTIDDPRGGAVEIRRAQRQQANTKSLQTATGDDTWTKFGTFGVVLRRGDFLRRGADESVGWDDIQSITVTVFVSTNAAVTVSLSDLLLTGGSGPDTGEFGLSAYDYRVIDVDTRTGAKSNPSPEGTGVDALRRSITVDPVAYGDSSIRQWIYRRGGTLNDNWYYIGKNTADGGVFTDDVSDAAAAQGELLEIDNAQPVSTVNTSGTTVLAQPVFSIFGPAQDFLFACGDPYKAGSVYYCKRGRPDSWPPANIVEVCSPSEPLQAGGVYGTQPFVFSKKGMYFLLPNAGALDSITSLPTSCKHGMHCRWGLCVGPKGIYFVSYDGVYRTGGGEEELLSDQIDPLFHNKVVNDYQPIDLSIHSAIRLEIHDNDLWFLYQDIQGNRQVMIMALTPPHYWRHYNFVRPLSSFRSDEAGPRMLLGGKTSGTTYSHEGTSDDGQEIACLIATPFLDQGVKRQMKTYGDVTLDAARSGVAITVQTVLDTGLTTLQPVVITSDTQADL